MVGIASHQHSNQIKAGRLGELCHLLRAERLSGHGGDCSAGDAAVKVTIDCRKNGLLEVRADGKTYVCLEAHVRSDGPVPILDLSIPLGQPQEAEDEFRTMDSPPDPE